MTTTADTALIRADGLALIRGGRVLFARLSLALDAHDLVTLVGPNGSGKSSLLRLLAGLMPAAAGTLLWRGRPVDDDPDTYRDSTRYLGHADALKPTLSVAENLAVHAALQGGAPAEAQGAALATVGLADLADQPARILSSGQRRRLSLARLLVRPAPLWLLDEPTVGLDVAGVAAFAGLLARHLEGGGAALVATHLDFGLTPTQRLTPADFAPTDADIDG